MKHYFIGATKNLFSNVVWFLPSKVLQMHLYPPNPRRITNFFHFFYSWISGQDSSRFFELFASCPWPRIHPWGYQFLQSYCKLQWSVPHLPCLFLKKQFWCLVFMSFCSSSRIITYIKVFFNLTQFCKKWCEVCFPSIWITTKMECRFFPEISRLTKWT